MTGASSKCGAIAPLTAPVLTESIHCQRCPVGCATTYDPVEFCPFVPTDYPTGATVATRGERHERAWFVKNGAAAGTWGAGKSADVLYPPGSIIGLEGLLSETNVVSVWTLAQTTICEIERQAFAKWLERSGKIADTLRQAAADLIAAATFETPVSES